jgi:hypothetical protein
MENSKQSNLIVIQEALESITERLSHLVSQFETISIYNNEITVIECLEFYLVRDLNDKFKKFSKIINKSGSLETIKRDFLKDSEKICVLSVHESLPKLGKKAGEKQEVEELDL